MDANSEQYLFLEKMPLVTSQSLGPDTTFPQLGFIACEIETTWLDEAGRVLAKVNADIPWGVASSSGATQFVISKTQIAKNETDA